MRGLQAGLALLILLLAVLLPQQLPVVGESVWLGAGLASAITALGWGLLGTWRVRSLLAWLRQPQERTAPALGGAFSELVYRIERLLDGGRKPLTLNRLDPAGRQVDFAELDAMAEALWNGTEPALAPLFANWDRDEAGIPEGMAALPIRL